MSRRQQTIAALSILSLLALVVVIWDIFRSRPSHSRPSHPRVVSLVNYSENKRTAGESGILSEDSLTPDAIAEAVTHIQECKDYTSYHLLIALRLHHPEAYKNISHANKAAILCSALQNLVFLNDWGVLLPSGSYDDESAKALLETGKNSIPFLLPLLDVEDAAPLWGSKEATISHVYKFRRNDFAYRYAMLVLGEAPVFHDETGERNKAIAALHVKLGVR